EHFGTSMALVRKVRHGETTRVAEVIGDVKGKRVIIYDDMLRSGGSLINAAKAYANHGAFDIYVVISHCALDDQDVVKKICVTPCISRILTTNSHPMSQCEAVKNSGRFIVADVSGVFAEAIKKIIV
ncbi:MAG: phosphoribosyltransferase family protein, partial [Patescibacteria group bacterium]